MREFRGHIELYVAVGFPTIAVLASLTVSLIQVSAIRDELKASRADSNEALREIRADVRELRSDMKLLTGKVHEMMAQRS
jgi:hypothetical protein